MIKEWIFLKSTQAGLFKNIQDGIFKPLGSRKIQKTKAETVLVDTLYLYFSISFTRNTWPMLWDSDHSWICCGADVQPDTVAGPELPAVQEEEDRGD